MNTELLIRMLAAQVGPAPAFPAVRRLAGTAAVGLLASGALALLMIGPLPAPAFYTPAPWIKVIYALLLMAGAAGMATRLSRPAVSARAAWTLVLGIVAVMFFAGAVTWAQAVPGDRWSVLLGQTWWMCPWVLMMLSLPGLLAILLAMRTLAPTRLREAGFAAGLLAGTVGALGYSVACPETSLAFVAVWYTLGMALTAGLGQWLGPKVLRW